MQVITSHPPIQDPHARGFICSFCGSWRPWRLLSGWGFRRRLRFCESCINFYEEVIEGVGA